jgi:hypothetical protein
MTECFGQGRMPLLSSQGAARPHQPTLWTGEPYVCDCLDVIVYECPRDIPKFQDVPLGSAETGTTVVLSAA